MSKFVFWTGVYNIVAGISFLFPGLVARLGVNLPDSNFWVFALGSAVIFVGVVLVLCARDLAARASLVYWEGILRVAGFLLFAGYGFLGDLGIVPGALGVVEILIGIVYLVGLPTTVNRSPVDLLLDRVV